MKRTFSILLILALLISCMPFAVSASETGTTTKQSVEYLEDGSYFVTEWDDTPILTRATTSRTKTKTYYTADNVKVFVLKLTGYFTYDGVTATAVDEEVTLAIYDSTAKFVSKNAYHSGAGVYGSGTVTYLGYPCTAYLSITCSANGTIS